MDRSRGSRTIVDVEFAAIIICPDCGGHAHLVQPPRDDEVVETGDVLVYRCEECLDRWDGVVDEEDFSRESPAGWSDRPAD